MRCILGSVLVALVGSSVGQADPAAAVEKLLKAGAELKYEGTGAGKVVVEVDLPRPTAETLPALVQLQNLRGLRLGDAVSAKALAELHTLKHLEWLNLYGVGMTDNELKPLVEFPKLRSLGLQYTSVTDAGFKHLAALKSLEGIVLLNGKMTGSGLQDLANLPDLRWLTFVACAITDEGLREVSRLTNLRELSLQQTRITEKGLVHVAKLPRLETLSLAGTAWQGPGLLALAVPGQSASA